MIDWKLRYTELVEQIDRQQARSKKRQALLTAGLKTSARLVRGLDKRVDQSLLALQALLRQDNLKNVDLAVAVDTLEKQSDQCVTERESNIQRVAKSIKKIAAQTRSLSVSNQTQQILKQLEGELDAGKLRFDQLPEHLETLMAQHRTAVRENKKQKRGRQTIWRRWLSKDEAPEAGDAEDQSLIDDEEADIHSEDNDEGLMEACPDQPTGELNNETEHDDVKPIKTDSDDSETLSAAARKASSKKPPQIDLRAVVRGQFTALLQQLGRTDTTAALQSKLGRSLSVNDIADLTTKVCDTSMETIAQERQVFYSTVKRMNSRITASMNQIDACRAIDEGGRTANVALHQTIHSSCSDIETSLANATSLDEVKEQLAQQMASMKTALATHEQQMTEQDVATALDSLSQQITHVGDMSRATLFQMDNQAKETTTDRDSGLPNRAAFRLTAPRMIDEQRRTGANLMVAVCMVDHFQKLTGGAEPPALAAFFHALANVYRQLLRGTDRIFRLGENEFVFLLPDTDRDSAAALLEKLKQTIDRTPVSAQRVTVSLGIAECKTTDAAESVLARAKRACKSLSG